MQKDLRLSLVFWFSNILDLFVMNRFGYRGKKQVFCRSLIFQSVLLSIIFCEHQNAVIVLVLSNPSTIHSFSSWNLINSKSIDLAIGAILNSCLRCISYLILRL